MALSLAWGLDGVSLGDERDDKAGHRVEPMVIEGRVEAHLYEKERYERGGSSYLAKIKLKNQKRVQGFRAHIKTRADSDDQHLRTEEVYISHKPKKEHVWHFGRAKKRLGHEYEAEASDRLLMRRSMIYQRLETLGYVGRQKQIGYDYGGGRGLHLGVFLGVPDSEDHNLVLTVGQDVEERSFGWQNHLLLQKDKTEVGTEDVFANMISCWGMLGASHEVEGEVLVGVDGIATELRRLEGKNSKVVMAGVKGLWGYHWLDVEGVQIKPTLSLSGLAKNIREGQQNDYQWIYGVQGVFDQTRAMVYADRVWTSGYHDSNKSDNDSRYNLGLAHYF